LGEWFTISVEFVGDVDRLFIENTWETNSGEIKREVKEYTIPLDVKEEPKGVITRQWKTVNPNVKPYRILKVWVKDAKGNQSNVLSGEVKVVAPEITKDVPPDEGVIFWVTDIKRGSLDTGDHHRCSIPMDGVKWTFKVHRQNKRSVACKITKLEGEWECRGAPDWSGDYSRELQWNITPNATSSWSDNFFVCESRSCKVKITYRGKYADGVDIKSVLVIDLK